MRTYGLRFDVNCSILFTELPLVARAAAAKAAGFDGVEFWWPWAGMAPSDAEADAFVRSIGDAGVELVSLNFHAGDMAAGERGILSHPGRAGEFREHIAACVEIAAADRVHPAERAVRAAGGRGRSRHAGRRCHRQSSARRGGCG